jgi:hypothetical protein
MKKCLLAIAMLTALCIATISRAQVVLTFDDVAAGPLSTFYQAKGATFNFPLVRDYASTPGFAHSGTQAIELCFAAEFCKSTLNVNFTTGETHVKVFVGFTSQIDQASPVLLRALDANGATVAQKTAVVGPSAAAIPVQIPLEVTSATANIRQIIVGFASPDAFNNGLVFDDFEFDAAGPPPVCTAPVNPTVTMTQPQANTTVQINEFLLQGTVTTAAPLDQATLTVTGPSGTKVSNFLGTIVQPTSAPFGAIRVDESLFPGTNTVTLAVHNCHGAGQASSTVTFTPVANGTVVKLIAMEITQATQDVNNSVRLIAGKPTAVRLYFTTTGATAKIDNVRGDLSGFQEGGNAPFLATSVGTTDIDTSQDLGAKRLNLVQSLNFLLSPDFYQQGLTHFRVERLNVAGPGGATLACDGCIQWDAGFVRARPLNLVVVPFLYLKSNLTADAGATLIGSLGYLNNVYPLTGNFPTDTSGINLTILSTRPTDLVLPRDNDRMLFALQGILDNLLSQSGNPNPLPADTHILGVAPSGSGGVANNPGTAAYGDIRALESATFPATDPEFYGATWAQEIAHNFGRLHVSTSHGEMPPTDPNFPYLHGGIGEPGLAIGTEGWNGTPFVLNPGVPADGSKHAHDFMSYGLPNDKADHTFSWVSPFTYQGLMSSFPAQALEAAAPQPAVDKLVVSGTINKAGVATLRPFYITHTGFAKGAGTTGAFSVTLQDAAGKTLLIYHFDAQAIENSTSVMFSQFVPWTTATKLIVLKRNQTILAKRKVSPHKPTVKVLRPKSGETWGAKAIVTWRAADADKDALTYTVLYNTGDDQRWVPIATDVKGLSATVDTRLLVGSKNARVRVRATDGVNTKEADSAAFHVPEHPPLVSILGAAKGKVVNRQSAEFTGAAYDPRDGMLPANRLKWTSDRDGELGTGAHITLSRSLSDGAHVITLTATNSQGQVTSSQTTIVAK